MKIQENGWYCWREINQSLFLWGELHFVQTVFLLSGAAHNIQACKTACTGLSNQHLIHFYSTVKGLIQMMSDEQSGWPSWEQIYCGFECLILYDSLMVRYMMLGQIGTQNLVFIQFSQYQKLIASFPEQENLSCLQWFIAQVSHSLIKSERMKQHFSRQFRVMPSVLQQFAYFYNPRASECLWYSPNGM